MVSNSGLRSNDGVIAHLHAASKPNLTHDQAVLTNLHIVGNVHQIVDLAPLANDGWSKGTAVNGGIGTNLHIVMNDDDPHLQHLAMVTFVKDIAIAVGANHCSGMNADAASHLASWIDHHVGMEPRVIANNAVRTDVHRAQQRAALADGGPRADYAIRPDVRGSINLRRGINHCGWVDPGSMLNGWMKERQQACHGDSRISHTDHYFGRRLHFTRNQDGRSTTAFGGFKI